MSDEFKEAISAIDALLDDERQALLTGDFDALQKILDQKEDLIKVLSTQHGSDFSGMQMLAPQIERNQELLSHALDGVRAVARRLAELRQVRESLDTYDATGRRKSVPAQSEHSLEKRA